MLVSRSLSHERVSFTRSITFSDTNSADSSGGSPQRAKNTRGKFHAAAGGHGLLEDLLDKGRCAAGHKTAEAGDERFLKIRSGIP